MEKLLDSKRYREIVIFYENELQALEDDAGELNQLFLPVINHLHFFPRSSQEARVLQDQLSSLLEGLIEAIAIIKTLATIAQVKEEGKEELPVYPLLEEQLKLQVKTYVDYYHDRKKKPSDKENKKGKDQSDTQ
jgi:hypothetical protein